MAYTRLLRVYYRREQPIGIGDEYRLTRATSKAQRAAVDSVLREFFEQREDGWHNKRADAEIGAYQAQAEHNRAVGILGGRPKKTRVVSENNHSGSFSKPNDNPSQNHKPEPEPERSKATPLAPSPSDSKPEIPHKGNGKDQTAIIEQIPIVGGPDFPIHQSFVDELDRLYPAVEPLQTLREIRGWCLGNPTKRKTASGVRRFVTAWFAREQNKNG